MSSNVPTIPKIEGRWTQIRIEATMFTDVAELNPYFILSFPNTKDSLIIEPEKKEFDKELAQLFSEFAKEDMELAEMGIDDYRERLIVEDGE
jgi:hypothetical protein